MRRLPIFPLGTVLVPGAPLPLHIFEPRYRALMGDLTAGAGAGEFGVVLIDRGSEVGGGETRRRVGTVARLIGHQALPDGRHLAVAAGRQRFVALEWLPDDPYPLAMVDDFVDEDDTEVGAEELKEAERRTRRTLALAAELGHEVAPLGFRVADDRGEALWQLCAAAPLGPLDAQRLLETRSPTTRCRMLLDGVEELASVLAFRLSGA